MATIQELVRQIENVNALGIKNLNEKGIMLVGSPGISGTKPVTTYQIMNAIADILTGGGACLDNTVTFTLDGEPCEIVSVKNGNSVNKPYSIADENGVPYEWYLNDEMKPFPYTPTENVVLEGKPVENLVPIDINKWYKNEVATNAYKTIVCNNNTSENVVDYLGVDGYEYIYFPVSLEKEKTYIFSLDYRVVRLNYSSYGQPNKPFISFAETFVTTSATQWSNALSSTIVDNPKGSDYVTYSVTYQPSENFDGYVILDTGCIQDDMSGTLYIKNLVVKQISK